MVALSTSPSKHCACAVLLTLLRLLAARYERDGAPTFRPVSGWINRERVLLNWISYRKDDLCAFPRSTTAALSSEVQLLQAMRSWMREASDQSSFRVELTAWRDKLFRFSRANFPLAMRRLPILYLFSGADLWTALAFSPEAPSVTMVSALPLGDPRCFLHHACREAALARVQAYERSWSFHGFAWTETVHMQAWTQEDVMPGTHSALGVLPLLLLCLQATGHELVSVTRAADPTHGATLLTNRTQVSYVAHQFGRSLQVDGTADEQGELRKDVRWLDRLLLGRRLELRKDVRWLDRLLLGRRLAPFMGLFKAAESTWKMTNEPDFWRWYMGRAAAVVQDETGLLPSTLEGTPGWRVRAFGDFGGLERSYATLRIPERWNSPDCFGLGANKCAAKKNATIRMHDELRRAFPGPAARTRAAVCLWIWLAAGSWRVVGRVAGL